MSGSYLIINIKNKKINQKQLKQIQSVLQKGGILVYPTETAYGIGCNALDQKAVKKIYQIKNRPYKQPLPVIVPDIENIEKIAILNPIIRKLIEKFHPGPLVIACQKKPIIPDIVNKNGIAFRISNNNVACAITSIIGKPVIATSANKTGFKTPYSIKGVLKSINEEDVDIIIDSGILEKNEPSTLIDFQLEPSPQIIRIGEIKAKAILTELDIPKKDWEKHVKFI